MVEPIDYAQRWWQIVEERRQYMEALHAPRQGQGPDYWASRVGFFRSSQRVSVDPDIFLVRVMARVSHKTTVLDVGAGAGRFALPLAKAVRRVVAVEPSPSMVEALREEAALVGITNLDIVQSTWEEAEVEPADVLICSHVIYPIADIVPFLRKLDEKTLDSCFLYLHAGQPPWEDEVWERYHGRPPQPQPTYLDAYNLLHQMGILANVEIVSYQREMRFFPSLEEAVDRYRRFLIADNTPEGEQRLRQALEGLLIQTEEGWQMPPKRARSAIVWWSKNPA